MGVFWLMKSGGFFPSIFIHRFLAVYRIQEKTGGGRPSRFCPGFFSVSSVFCVVVFSCLYLHQRTQQCLLVASGFDAVRLTGFFEFFDRDTALGGVGASRRIRLSGENLNSTLDGVRPDVGASLCEYPAIVELAEDRGDTGTSRAFVRSILRVSRQVLEDARGKRLNHGVCGAEFSGFRLADGEVVEAQQFMEEGQVVSDDRLLGLLLNCGGRHVVAGRLVGFQLAKKVNQFLF